MLPHNQTAQTGVPGWSTIDLKRSLSSSDTSIAWKNLGFTVNEYTGFKRRKKTILRGLNGTFSYGTLNGLMGTSGSGKTTLLNCLSGSIHSGLSDGTEISLNSQQGERIVSYYIRQHVHETIPGQLTVGQILRYAFAFKNGRRGEAEIQSHISSTMAALMLPKDLLSRPFALCSGGEQKRVAIAQELMSLKAPMFLFIDEPTTGLDSAAAFEVMHCLKTLVETQNITVITSIHSPNDETLNLFDQLYVLARGGVCVYSGAPDRVKKHLEQTIPNFRILEDQPPIEALLKIACNGYQCPGAVALAQNCSAHRCPDMSSLTVQPYGFPRPRKFFSLYDLYLQFCRMFRIFFLCNFRQIAFKVVQYVVMYLIFASIYNHRMSAANACYPIDPAAHNQTCASDFDNSKLASENNLFHGYNFLLVGFLMMCTSAVIYSPLVKIYQNESQNYWYSLGVFYWSSALVSFLEMSLLSVVISTLAYFFTSQHAADDYSLNLHRFSMYAFFIWLLCLYMQSFGQLVGSILLNHTEMAIIISQVIYIIFTVVNDYFVDTEKTGNVAFIGFANIVALKYITKGMIYTFYGLDKCHPDTEFSSFMVRFRVEEHLLGQYVTRVLINIAVVRLATILLLYIKFNTFADHPIMRLARWIKSKASKRKTDKNLRNSQAVLVEKSPKGPAVGCQISIELEKSKEELEFEDFIRNQVSIGWRHLTLMGKSSLYELSGRDKKAQSQLILRNLNGQFKFGTLNGLMGTSGAGKTSCLKVLNGRCKTRLSDETEFYLSKYTAIKTCFITQEVSGHLMPGLTAKEMLVYASMLKNAGAKVDHEQIALRWLQKLDLLNTINTKVEKCSGGEQKRLAVAQELTALDRPNLICIDEPTSGLDTNSAEIVISILRKLVLSHPITIVTSIHQPTTEILYMFDQLYVLARGGVCIYSGPPNRIQAHLNSIRSSASLPQFPIETLIKLSCCAHSHPITQQLAQTTTDQVLQSTESLLESTLFVSDGVMKNRPRFSLYSVFILSRRYLAHLRGHLWPMLLAFAVFDIAYAGQLQIFFPSRIAIPSGCVSIEDDLNAICHRTADGILEDFEIFENYKYNFFMLCIFLFLLLLQSSLIFGKEFVYFLNEHRNGWYSSGSFYLMKSLFEMLPLPFILAIYVYICDIYSPIRPGIYWPLVGLLLLASLAIQGLAHCFSLLANANITRLTILTVSFLIIFLQISNFFIPLARLHYLYTFIANFSIIRFIFEAALLLQYGFGRCTAKQVQLLLYSMSIDSGHLRQCIWMLLFNLVLYRLIALYLLIFKASPIQTRKERVARIERYQELISSNTAAPVINNIIVRL